MSDSAHLSGYHIQIGGEDLIDRYLQIILADNPGNEDNKEKAEKKLLFILHRLQNPEALRYFREIIPGIYGQLLDHPPALAPRSALVLGECVQAPALVEIREVSPVPKNKNPKFYRSCTQKEKKPDFEAVCDKWEGRRTTDTGSGDDS